MKLDPGHTQAHNNLAFALLQIKRIDEARRHYQETLRIDPANFVALYGLGRIALAADDYTKAKTYLEKALKEKPGQEEIRETLEILKDRL